MKEQDKQLLLKDLCARLPYGARARFCDGVKEEIDDVWDIDMFSGAINADYIIDDVKLYLRPMSSITEEEREYLKHHINDDFVDYCNEHYLDYRGLIPMGLALEAPEGMYNKEESEKGSEISIPKTVDEAVKTLAKIVSEEDRDYLLENGAISMHNSLGRWIRNEWGLWTDSELKNELKKKGFEHPDDMSNYIIEEFIKYWNNKI